jgi:hypothetical protein
MTSNGQKIQSKALEKLVQVFQVSSEFVMDVVKATREVRAARWREVISEFYQGGQV